MKVLNAAIKLDSTYAPAYNARGLLLDRLGNHPAACLDFSKALSFWENPVFYQNRACCLRNMGKLDQAVHDFTEALALDPANPLIHSNLGLLYRKMQKHDQATT
jgi:Flp pilus assembly protein TadD